MSTDPIQSFRRLFRRAQRAGLPLPEAMVLATADAKGRPSARYVLLKQADARGFVFFTNEQSPKGADLAANPRAALVFYWHEIGQQVRVEGKVVRVDIAAADEYWATRPRESQLAALASDQSRIIESQARLLQRWRDLAREFRGRDVPRPRHWGGFRVVPDAIEFWTRGEHRLHRRELFRRTRSGWTRSLLQP